jgi:hypothetical protein
MSIFGKLFRQPIAPEAAQIALAKGCDKMWMREFKEAQTLLDVAARGHSHPAVPMAYLSLLERMQGKYHVPVALKLASRALKEDEACFEALAAFALATLHTDRLTLALETWGLSWKRDPFDAEGHHLRLVLYLLFIEAFVDAVVTKDDMAFNFDPDKPLTRGAVRLLDGYPEVATRDFSATELTVVGSLGVGLASCRFVMRQECLRRERNQGFVRTSEYGSAVRELAQALRNVGQFPGLAGNITLFLGIEASIDQLLMQLKKYERE